MLLSEKLINMGLTQEEFIVVKEEPSKTLALTEYYPDDNELCTFLDNAKFLSALDPKRFNMAFVTPELKDSVLEMNIGVIVMEQPRLMFFNLHNYLCSDEQYSGAKFENEIHPSAVISKLASLPDHGVRIGKDVVIEDFVKIYPNVTIGDRTTIRSGAVIGGVGFEFKRDGDVVSSVEHVGGVVIGNDVEIQNNTCVDRGIYPWSDTVIGDYCKIDNLIHVAHGVVLGKRVMAAASAIFGGRVIVGDDAWIGVFSVIRNGITIGARARVNMGAVVSQNVPDDVAVTGNFAIEHKKFIAWQKKKLQE